jgi:branched-chain amino acid transport system permease protein
MVCWWYLCLQQLLLLLVKYAWGLRSDYLAISTLLISGIIVSVIKHEEWLSRGVKNVIGLKRPAPYEVRSYKILNGLSNLIETYTFLGPYNKRIL